MNEASWLAHVFPEHPLPHDTVDGQDWFDRWLGVARRQGLRARRMGVHAGARTQAVLRFKYNMARDPEYVAELGRVMRCLLVDAAPMHPLVRSARTQGDGAAQALSWLNRPAVVFLIAATLMFGAAGLLLL